MKIPGFLRDGQNGVTIAVKVQPRASKNGIGEPAGDELKISVTAPPVDSAANQATLKLLSEVLGCPRAPCTCCVAIPPVARSSRPTEWMQPLRWPGLDRPSPIS